MRGDRGEQVRRRGAGRPVVDTDVADSAAGRQVGDERDRRDVPFRETGDGVGDRGIVGSLEDHSRRAAAGDLVEPSRDFVRAAFLAQME
jgi:hypothetical protein